MERRFLMVDAAVLPEVFLKVLKAKELLANGAARNISAATRQAGISRSAFYKYKDCIFDSENSREVIAFPMNSNAQDLMLGSPSEVTEQQLREVHIRVRK